MKIGILGGTGPAGTALGARLASVGHHVVLGSRSRYRALEVRDQLVARWPGHDLSIDAADNEAAADAELVVIATPWDGAAETAHTVADHLAGKVVLCMCNALARVHNEFQPLVPPRGSVTAAVQAELARSQVVAALHHVPAKELGDIDAPVESDVLICSDHPDAVAVTSQLIGAIPGLRPLDAGRLSNATAIEAFTAVLLQLNTRYRTRVAVRFTGIDEGSP